MNENIEEIFTHLLNGGKCIDELGDEYRIINNELVTKFKADNQIYRMRLSKVYLVEQPTKKTLWSIVTKHSYEATFSPERKDECVKQLIKAEVPYQLNSFEVEIDNEKL